MDSIDTPLNETRYITDQLEKILAVDDEKKAFNLMCKSILNRTNPGPGGFYDSLGDPECWYRFPDLKNWQEDPGNAVSPFKSFPIHLHLLDDRLGEMRGIPQAWQKAASVLYEMPMRVRYDNLDPDAEYTLKIKYIAQSSENLAKTVYLQANGEKLEYDTTNMEAKNPLACFALPRRITARGSLVITWATPYGEPTTFVAEIFLTKRQIVKL
jgi:hypothetical protein